LLALAAAATAWASDVHDLDADTFKDFIKEHDLVLAECESLSHPMPSQCHPPTC
jgi:hypothetical protein